MKETTLTPDNLTILKKIVASRDIEVPQLAKLMKMDRGKLEGGIAILVEHNLIDRKIQKIIIHKLTLRGTEACKGLVERKIISLLLTEQVSMKDLNATDRFAAGDISAGIGILLKSGIIKINKGVITLTNVSKAKEFSQDIQNALTLLNNDTNSIDDKLAKQLAARGFIEIEESNTAIVTPKITKAELNAIKPLEEVSKLTPRLIISGEWKKVTFKP